MENVYNLLEKDLTSGLSVKIAIESYNSYFPNQRWRRFVMVLTNLLLKYLIDFTALSSA